MKIVVLAGGLSTERDVSFVTGNMVSKALRAKGHQVILLDVFMGYSNKKEDLDGIFDRSEEVSVKVEGIPETAPDIAKVKAMREDKSDSVFRSECHRDVSDGGHRIYGASRRKRRERKSAGGAGSVWRKIYGNRILQQCGGNEQIRDKAVF